MLGELSKILLKGWNGKEGKENKDFKNGEQAESRGGCLKEGVGSNPLMNSDYTNYHLYRSWMYIFRRRYSPVSLFDILNLAKDSLLKRLCCCFLLFLGRFFAVCACVCVLISEM